MRLDDDDFDVYYQFDRGAVYRDEWDRKSNGAGSKRRSVASRFLSSMKTAKYLHFQLADMEPETIEFDEKTPGAVADFMTRCDSLKRK